MIVYLAGGDQIQNIGAGPSCLRLGMARSA